MGGCAVPKHLTTIAETGLLLLLFFVFYRKFTKREFSLWVYAQTVRKSYQLGPPESTPLTMAKPRRVLEQWTKEIRIYSVHYPNLSEVNSKHQAEVWSRNLSSTNRRYSSFQVLHNDITSSDRIFRRSLSGWVHVAPRQIEQRVGPIFTLFWKMFRS